MKEFSLDKSEIEALIELLQESTKVGFSLESSPLVPLLEIMIDLNLRIAEFFKEGGPLSQRTNPSLKEFDISDALGNAKIVKIFENPKWVHESPEISFFFREQARKLVLFKKSGSLSSFMEDKRTADLQTKEHQTRIPKKINSSRKDQYWYFRRAKARNKRQKHIVT